MSRLDMANIKEAHPVDDPAALVPFGWAPGGYTGVCGKCGDTHGGSEKRSPRCQECAEKLRDEAAEKMSNPPTVGEGPEALGSSAKAPIPGQRADALVVVPREPTVRMIEAGFETGRVLARDDAKVVWHAMRAAGPTTPAMIAATQQPAELEEPTDYERTCDRSLWDPAVDEGPDPLATQQPAGEGVKEVCPACNGDGHFEENEGWQNCTACRGSGTASSEPGEVCWLVERGDLFASILTGAQTHYLFRFAAQDGWTTDVHQAKRFPTREAAEATPEVQFGKPVVRASEHVFGLALSATQHLAEGPAHQPAATSRRRVASASPAGAGSDGQAAKVLGSTGRPR